MVLFSEPSCGEEATNPQFTADIWPVTLSNLEDFMLESKMPSAAKHKLLFDCDGITMVLHVQFNDLYTQSHTCSICYQWECCYSVPVVGRWIPRKVKVRHWKLWTRTSATTAASAVPVWKIQFCALTASLVEFNIPFEMTCIFPIGLDLDLFRLSSLVHWLH